MTQFQTLVIFAFFDLNPNMTEA